MTRNKKTKGLFITLEGIEGAGKSTHIPYIVELLQNNKHEVVSTREPGGTKLGEKIRNILLTKDDININDDSELLLMFAARAQHIHEVILPAMASGKTVLCDRFTDSSYAYQSGGRGIDSNKICQLVKLVHADLKPDLTLLFDLPVDLGIKRAQNRNAPDRFESEEEDFFQAVRYAYLKIAESEPDRVKVIDANMDIDSVQASILKILTKENLC